MPEEERINPGHGPIRDVARILGPLLILAGGIFMAVGMISFFSAFGAPLGSMGPPQYFWCCFVGMPLLALGVAVTKVAYLGAIFRYVAGETAPVQKDTFNYLAEGIRPGVRDLAQAVSQGLAAGSQSPPVAGSKYCSACGQAVTEQAKYCAACGQKMA